MRLFFRLSRLGLCGILLFAPANSFAAQENHFENRATWWAGHYPALLAPAQLQSLYQTLIKGYWIPKSGIFLSFAGTTDLRLSQQAATYDQAVVGILLLRLGDLERVKALLAFYEEAWQNNQNRMGARQGKQGLANFYNAFFPVEGIEKTIHVGPNAWMGLLASRYYRQTGDTDARALALNIAEWIMRDVPHKNGAVAMGEIAWDGVPWPQVFSTENNISTYAFLSDLLKINSLPPNTRRNMARERNDIRRWLTHSAYQPAYSKVIRGMNPQGLDTVGAVDCYTWFVEALEPAQLRKQGVPPEDLLHSAQKLFMVEVGRRSGVDVADEDLALATYEDAQVQHARDPIYQRPRGDGHRLIWYEGTAQYILTLQDMARDVAEQAFAATGAKQDMLLGQAQDWLKKAKELSLEMDRAAFRMPWGTVYPSATHGQLYVHGWPAPPGTSRDHVSDAVAPLAWRMLAGMGYEPLSDRELGTPQQQLVQRLPLQGIHDPGTTVLYGASEEMVVQAWDLYNDHHFEGAERQARATIAMWEKDAAALQALKQREVGHLITYVGDPQDLQRIHNYWALNDVAAAYFILGKIGHETENISDAKAAFKTILTKYALAQIWDPHGWFWSPTMAIQAEYANHEEYASLNALIPPWASQLAGLPN